MLLSQVYHTSCFITKYRVCFLTVDRAQKTSPKHFFLVISSTSRQGYCVNTHTFRHQKVPGSQSQNHVLNILNCGRYCQEVREWGSIIMGKTGREYLIYGGMKRAPNLEKGHFRTSKRQRTAGYPYPNMFFKFFRPNKIFTILIKRECVRPDQGLKSQIFRFVGRWDQSESDGVFL